MIKTHEAFYRSVALRHRLVVLFISAFLSTSVSAADVQYVYDQNGRLVGVVDGAGDSAQYVYDPAGNIVEIKRFSAGALAIVEFSPANGPVGTAVTISGSGFSATASQNTVKFNGVTATITSASANKLVATVPSGATDLPPSLVRV